MVAITVCIAAGVIAVGRRQTLLLAGWPIDVATLQFLARLRKAVSRRMIYHDPLVLRVTTSRTASIQIVAHYVWSSHGRFRFNPARRDTNYADKRVGICSRECGAEWAIRLCSFPLEFK